MGMKGNNFFHQVTVTAHIVPQVLTAAGSAAGAAILEPWRTARQLAFILQFGAMTGTTPSFTAVVQGLRRDDGTTWEALKEQDGTTTLQFTATLLDDGGDGESAATLGTLDLSDIDAETYKSVRLVVTEDGGGTGTAPVAVSSVLYDLYTHASGQTDDLWAKVRPAPAVDA